MPRTKSKMRDISKEDFENDYIEFKNLTKIAEKYGVPNGTVLYYFEKLKIQYEKKIRNYPVNHDFFKEITEETLYWAGFLAADGCIYFNPKYNSKKLLLDLAEKDLEHLLKFKNAIKAEHPLKERLIKNSLLNSNWNDSKTYVLAISSQKLVKDLEKFNIVPRKTKIYDLPEWLKNHELVHHFIRGYFDGDGSFYKDKEKNNRTTQHTMSIVGNLNFLKNIADVICNKLSIENGNIRFNGTMNVLTYGGNNLVKLFGGFIYENANIYLDRKYNMWKVFNDNFVVGDKRCKIVNIK